MRSERRPLPAGWLTLSEVAARRGDVNIAGVGAWVYRQMRDRTLIAAEDGDTIRVPAFLLTADGEPRPELRPLLEVLGSARADGLSRAAWLTTPTDELGGGVPEQVAVTDPARALWAAARFAAAGGAAR
ncbi:hypothetical protein ACU610_21270 [Geodermatophilus sp. URMC 61]|uniref:hypothetical protein n=1 Tax=Geodermatophilus sp. URMC 61 TaxID=3423411 RepID=UPI00406C5CC8